MNLNLIGEPVANIDRYSVSIPIRDLMNLNPLIIDSSSPMEQSFQSLLGI